MYICVAATVQKMLFIGVATGATSAFLSFRCLF